MVHGQKEDSPLFGVFFVMSVDTEVLDYHIYSKFCQKCSKKKSECKDNMNDILPIVNVTSIFERRSPAMEAEAAQLLSNRSIEKHEIQLYGFRWR